MDMANQEQDLIQTRIRNLRAAGIFATEHDGEVTISGGDVDRLYRFSRQRGLGLGVRARNDGLYTVTQKLPKV